MGEGISWTPPSLHQSAASSSFNDVRQLFMTALRSLRILVGHDCMILGISYTPRRQCSAYSALLFPFALSRTKPPIAISSTKKLLALPFMSHSHTTASSNFQLIINNALDNYKKCTKSDLISHPLTAQLQSCNSPSDILAVLHQQVHELDSRSTDERWSKWLDPTVNVIYVLSSTLAAGVSLVCFKR